MLNVDFSAKTVHMGSDHAGLALKDLLAAHLHQAGYTVHDHGCHTKESCDYPNYAKKVCDQVVATAFPGILVCGSGIGMSIAANRVPGIRAALCTHEFHAKACRNHNNANIICFGERVTAPGLAVLMTEIFLSEPFEGGRHARRVDAIETVKKQ